MEDATDWTAEETSHHLLPDKMIAEEGRPKLSSKAASRVMQDASRISVFSESHYQSSEFHNSSSAISIHDQKRTSKGSITNNRSGPPQLARQEAMLVCYSKILVAVVLMVATIVLGYFTYHFSSGEETLAFENQVSSLMKIASFWFKIPSVSC